ncbi:MAG: hypothetical protein K2K66_05985 [Ruminococcus sp.]|nr:hypothetical protein [Ruminococcus sp.]
MLRKKLRYIAVLSVFLLSGCGQMGEITEVKKPEQELMFLIKYDNWSEEEIHSASLITTDGKHIEVPDNLLGENGEMPDDWAEQLIQLSENTLVECTLPENDLAVMYEFVNSAEIENVPVFKEYAETVYDAGFNTLYLLKKTDDIYVQQKLCVSGETNEYIDDNKVIDFCNFMSDKKYYPMYIG